MIEPKTFDYVLFGQARRTWLWPECQCPGAQAERQQRLAREKQAAQHQQASEYDQLLYRAGLVGLLRDATFEQYFDRDDWPAATDVRSRVKLYAGAVERGFLMVRPWLVLHGRVGLGKSHLAAAVVRYLLDRNWTACYFRDWTSYLKRIQATWDRRASQVHGETEADVLAELTRGQLVVIDDLDKVAATDWTRSSLFHVLNTRYTLALPTILTFNRAPHDPALLDYIGEAVMDRIMQHAYDTIAFQGASYRLHSED